MSFRDHPRTAPIAEPAPESITPAPSQTSAPAPVTRPIVRTHTGMAWVGVGVAALLAVALVIFAAQNTRGVEVSFLWMTTSTPLVLALLAGAIGGVLLTLVLSTARRTQLRRRVRGQTR